MIWDLINSLGRLLLTAIVIYKVTQFRDTMNNVERAGLCLMASGSFLTSALIWEPDGPFHGWSVSLLTYGAIIFLAGRTWRDRRHQRANDTQVRMYDEWRAKG
jgi:hypothetical protein